MQERPNNPEGVVDDYRVLDSAWGFDPGEIHQPVTILQGDSDGLVPSTWAERLAARIPNSELKICPGEGHFLALAHYREIFAGLKPVSAA
jgi:pimeloyl-ACP methyl ester carboxylesterase